MKKILFLISIVTHILLLTDCKSDFSGVTVKTGHLPSIVPDYTGVTIPPNIAPMNFRINESGDQFSVTARSVRTGFEVKTGSHDGIIRFDQKAWKKLLRDSQGDSIEFRVFCLKKQPGAVQEFKPFHMSVAAEPVDQYLVYRLIDPGYYSWSEIRIMQRCLENFSEEPVFENQIMDKNCANCHSFSRNDPNRFMLHVRGSKGGTYFAENGKLTRTDPKIDGMPGSATYPAWHPEGRFVAFSSNQVRQSFYSQSKQPIEVFDLVSSLILYDRQTNEILNISDSDTSKFLLTFPAWSPDGKYLYFCRAPQYRFEESPTLEQLKETKYDVARKSFDPATRIFGETELVYNAAVLGKSASFPTISPDGKFMVFTLADYGTFPIWHPEADLYLLDLRNGKTGRMEINSNRAESYHTWSVNGKWLVFSSRRIDGRSSRPYFAYIDTSGNQGKPFILPQKDPDLYDRMLESFNRPELVNGRISIGPRDILKASEQVPLKAKPGKNEGDKSALPPKKADSGTLDNGKPIQ